MFFDEMLMTARRRPKNSRLAVRTYTVNPIQSPTRRGKNCTTPRNDTVLSDCIRYLSKSAGSHHPVTQYPVSNSNSNPKAKSPSITVVLIAAYCHDMSPRPRVVLYPPRHQDSPRHKHRAGPPPPPPSPSTSLPHHRLAFP
ncbi:hypothetical protein BS47DRAFT_465885 [Hydnum rufescens UP504]|uniref:Uncharacterized protein n=1 Tax=Hydnum rufescens UP504 TaxID=1448309 RepID=A0A9P6B4K8_9AGAM|nr:hypothetical protein BS47DRAFT_465885 [Hydnum rufescens UP504]